MKILHINSVCGVTGTGRIVTDLCETAMREGHTCLAAYGEHKYSNRNNQVPTIPIGNIWDCRAHGVRTRLLDGQGLGSRGATRRFLAEVDRFAPDIVHLHNLHGYYLNYEILFRYLKERDCRVVWTLHDCWPLTGHCAYYQNAGCDKWKTGCYDCPQKSNYPASLLKDNSRDNYARKERAFNGLAHMRLVAPSMWLADQVKESILKNYPIQVVPNGIDRKVYHPTYSDFRKKYGLENSFLILGVANVWEERKGLQTFLKLQEYLDESYKIVLVGLSEEQIRNLPRGILGFPRTDTPEKLAEIYTASDVFVHPGREETFGLTVVEALACGTYPIVCRGSACAEIVQETTGAIVAGDAESLCKAIVQYRSDPQKEAGPERYAEKYSREQFGRRVLEIYEELYKE